jgi:hypothetical protein
MTAAGSAKKAGGPAKQAPARKAGGSSAGG